MKRLRYVQVEVNRHGKEVIYFRRGAGTQRVRLPPLDSAEFRAAYDAAVAGQPKPHLRNLPVTKAEARKQRTERAIRRCLEAAKHRSKRQGLPHDLTLDWALAEVEEQDFRCALTGIEFFAAHERRSFQDPFAPSFDRKVPALGYVQSNIRIVCFAINLMLSDWGVEVFELVANSYRYQRQKSGLLSLTFLPSAGSDTKS